MLDALCLRSASVCSRRDLLRAAAFLGGGTLATFGLPSWVAAAVRQAAAPADQLAAMRAQMGAAPITSTTLTDRLTMLAGPGGNVAVLHGPDGKIVVDTFVQPAWTSLTAALDKMGPARITAAIDTHWHFDHADNNAAFRKAGAQIIAHDNTKIRLAEPHDLLRTKLPPAPAEALPTQTFKDTHKLDANGEQITLAYIPPAHTDTDISIHFANGNVLHLGDVFFNGMYPFIDASTKGSINGMIAGATLALKRADASTRIVPGHGPLGDAAALTRYRDMLVTVRDRVAKLRKSGQTVEQVVKAAPTRDLDDVWGKGFMTPANFLAIVYGTL
jgi:glyoxylase-like metal-dependent hydrolase (beta-lactamase superfamily II)